MIAITNIKYVQICLIVMVFHKTSDFSENKTLILSKPFQMPVAGGRHHIGHD